MPPVYKLQALIVRGLHFVTRRKIILVACMPKSGSTFLTKQLELLGGCHNVTFVPDYDRREQEISANSLFWRSLRSPHRHLVAQHHVRCSQHTINLIEAFGIRVIVLTRNFEDAVLSACDHTRNESIIWPMVFITDDLLLTAEHSGVSRFTLMFRMLGPWLANFYLSWKFLGPHLSRNNAPIYVKYEDFYSNEADNFVALCQMLGLSPQKKYLKPTSGVTRLNKGEVGRGSRELEGDGTALRAWNDIRECYPGIDLNSPIVPDLGSIDPK